VVLIFDGTVLLVVSTVEVMAMFIFLKL